MEKTKETKKTKEKVKLTKEFGSFFKEVKGNEGSKCHYPTRLDTYGRGCQHNCSYCVSPDTQILMFDGSIKLIKDLKIGDAIYGVKDGAPYKYFTKSIVLNKHVTIAKAYKITLANGNTLICSDNHQWLSNRGWKYTIGTMSGENQRPFLTINNHLLGFDTLFNIPVYYENDLYKKGYLRGIILGDAVLKSYQYTRTYKKFDQQYQFRLILKDERITLRVKKYLQSFGIKTNFFNAFMIDRKTKEQITVQSIRTHKKEHYNQISQLIEPIDAIDFKRGFLAGIYDAEGSSNITIRRIFNTDFNIINEIAKALDDLNFNYVFDKDQLYESGKICKTIRLIGGLSESLKFNIITNCIKINDEGVLSNFKLKTFNSKDLKIIKIEPYSESMELIDITTSTRNFIANGIISHNCYAKSLLDFRGLWDPKHPAIADINKIRRKIAKLPEGMPAIRLGGMTDCFQPLELKERVTYETIKALNEKNQPYLIVTKSEIVANDEYIEIMRKDLAHIQVTITCFDDDLYCKLNYEKASLPSKRIEAVEKLYKAGFDVQVRLSPFIPEFVDYKVLSKIKCNKILIEFLRVNSWIKKWFDIDYSLYTVSHGGYNHMPLELKQKYIKKIKGFKEITVCEDEDEAYEYWTNNFNPNPKDCCNLRTS